VWVLPFQLSLAKEFEASAPAAMCSFARIERRGRDSSPVHWGSNITAEAATAFPLPRPRRRTSGGLGFRTAPRSVLAIGSTSDPLSPLLGNVIGAMVTETAGQGRAWLTALLARRPAKVAAIALANKLARMAWAMMARGERYRNPVALAA
jgi:hypothetical protein